MSKFMRAIRLQKFGGPEVLKVENVEIPAVTESRLLVRLKSAGVNPVDTYIREGAFSNLPELPFTPGKDGAGTVKKIGDLVTDFQPGQRVFICSKSPGKYGTYAEYTTIDQKEVFPLANSLTFEQGAALGIPYFTAYRALILKAHAVANETILVHGASGAVGLATVQIAKAYNMKVIGTAGTPEGIKIVQDNGADCVFCHRDKNYLQKIMEVTEDKGVNVIIEMVANVNLCKDLQILAPKGRVMVVGSRGSVNIDPRYMMGPETVIAGIALLNSSEDEWKETSSAILAGIDHGWVKPVIDKIYDMEHASEAHRDIIHSKGAKGNLILSVEL